MKIELVNGNRISKWKWEKKEIVFPNDFFKRKKEKEKRNFKNYFLRNKIVLTKDIFF